MIFNRWFFFFIFNICQLIIIILGCYWLFVIHLNLITWQDLISVTILNIPLYTWVIGFVVVLSGLISTLITYLMTRHIEAIRARLNWLNLGKYYHPIFQQKLIYSDRIGEDIAVLRDKMIQQTKDLQELSAAPIFVGEETKEEIIEHERLRIARELHDSVSQELFAASMLISTLETQGNQMDAEKLELMIQRVSKIIMSAQTEMRALLLHLRPVELKDRTLSQGLENILSELNNRVGIEIEWELDSDVQLETGIEDHLFRISQEAIANTLRHADANRLEVFLSQSHDQVQLKIIDDGKGFDMNQVQESGNYGLTNMKERVDNLGGTLIINSHSKGTAITVNLPKNEGENND